MQYGLKEGSSLNFTVRRLIYTILRVCLFQVGKFTHQLNRSSYYLFPLRTLKLLLNA